LGIDWRRSEARVIRIRLGFAVLLFLVLCGPTVAFIRDLLPLGCGVVLLVCAGVAARAWWQS